MMMMMTMCYTLFAKVLRKKRVSYNIHVLLRINWFTIDVKSAEVT